MFSIILLELAWAHNVITLENVRVVVVPSNNEIPWVLVAVMVVYGDPEGVEVELERVVVKFGSEESNEEATLKVVATVVLSAVLDAIEDAFSNAQY